MPRHDWFRDDTMTRDRREERGFFGSDRSRDDYDYDRSRDRGWESGSAERGRPMGGWGGLMGDEDRGRFRERGRESENRNRPRSGDWGRDERGRYGSDDYSDDIPTDETERLIASNKVEGTPVYGRGGDRLGSVHNFMVDKYKGEVVYAVLRHGGFLGLGDSYYPLDWDDLDFDTRLGGYRVSLDEEDLERLDSYDSQGRRRSGRNRSRGRSGRGSESRGYDRERGNRYAPW